MDDEKKYKEALEKLQEALAPKDGRKISGLTRACIESIFPELKESEDDRIRKAIKKALQVRCDGSRIISDEPVTLKEAIAWLEKQESVEEIVARCKDSWYNEGKIDGKFEGIEGDVRYQQGWHDALEKQNEQKAIWHADDEKNLNAVLSFIEDEYLRRWLKDTIHKEYDKSTEWNKEDERMMLSIEQVMNCASLLNIVPQKIDKVRTWLKSIKERIE